jgi:cytochrome b6-f complex iron-sulfur subunit
MFTVTRPEQSGLRSFMPEDQENTTPADDPATLDRRKFVKVGTTSLAIAGVGACVFGFRYLLPNVLYEPSPVVSVGKPEHFPVGSVTLDPRYGIFVVHQPEGFYALSAVCTHLGCLSSWKPETGVIACPCHGTSFHRDGRVLSGPAPQPLPWLRVWLNDDGHLMVDRSANIAAHSELIQA